MKLRSGHTRPALAETSGNPYSRKRKTSTTTRVIPAAKKSKGAATIGNVEGVGRRSRRGWLGRDRQADIQEVDHMAQPPPDRGVRGRGRPRKTAQLATPLDSDLLLLSKHSQSVPSRPSSPSKSKGSRSPSKRGQITLDKPTSEAAIDMNYLARCNPAVVLTTFGDLKEAQEAISLVVVDLFEKLRDVPLGLIPAALQVASSPLYPSDGLKLANNSQHDYEHDANTPRKSKESHGESYFLEQERTPFPQDCLNRMKSTADKVREKAQWTQSQNAHERQWGALVNQLLCEVEIWQKERTQIVVLNV